MTRNSQGPGMRAHVRLLAAAFTVLVVAGCGGGGGGGGGNGGNDPTVTITASPDTITLGQSTTLDWTASSGTSCTASDGWSGTKTATGSESVTPTATGTTTYTLSCTGGVYSGSGSAEKVCSRNASLAVTRVPSNVRDHPNSIDHTPADGS